MATMATGYAHCAVRKFGDSPCGRPGVMWDYEVGRVVCRRHAPPGYDARQLHFEEWVGKWVGPNGLFIDTWTFDQALSSRMAGGIEEAVARLQLACILTWDEPGMRPEVDDALDEVFRILRR
jgi:hypothetical protein